MMLSTVSCRRVGAGAGEGRWAPAGATNAADTKIVRRPAPKLRTNV
jgi:hypothetical protein